MRTHLLGVRHLIETSELPALSALCSPWREASVHKEKHDFSPLTAKTL